MSSKIARTKLLLVLAVVVSLTGIYQVLSTPLFNKLLADEAILAGRLPIVLKFPGNEQASSGDPSVRTTLSRELIAKQLQYWDYPGNQDKTRIPSNGKYMTWTPWEAGLNNRRMSFEIAYVFAYLLNRTLVLPVVEGMAPFYERLDFETLFEERDLRSGVAIITAREWEALPEREAVLKDTVEIPWMIDGVANTVFCFPRVPDMKNESEMEVFRSFYRDRAPMGNNIVDHNTIPRMTEAKNINFLKEHIFEHYYYVFYFLDSSNFAEVNRLIRDHLHFPDAVTTFTARVLSQLPQSFSTMHYRRNDLQFQRERNVKPEQVFENTLHIFNENETIYVSTDEKPEVFDKEFCSVFNKRYRIITLRNYSKFVLDLKPVYLPMLEMQVASQGRMFVGTQHSTFSMYITRLRGYSRHIANTTYYFTTGDPGEGHLNTHTGWTIEQPEAWDNIRTSR